MQTSADGALDPLAVPPGVPSLGQHGVGRRFYIYDSTRISGKDLFRTIDHSGTRHSIKVATKAA